MSTIDREQLARLMAALPGDLGVLAEFIDAYGGRLAGVVGSILVGFGRRDVLRDDDEMMGLVVEAALVIQDNAAAWSPDGGALPWNWARKGIVSAVVRVIGHPQVEAEEERLASTPVESGAGVLDVHDVAARHPRLALLLEAIGRVDASERDRHVHLEYRLQSLLGDPSPAHTVAAPFGLTPANVRQIDRRMRTKLAALADLDGRYESLVDLPWITGRSAA